MGWGGMAAKWQCFVYTVCEPRVALGLSGM